MVWNRDFLSKGLAFAHASSEKQRTNARQHFVGHPASNGIKLQRVVELRLRTCLERQLFAAPLVSAECRPRPEVKGDRSRHLAISGINHVTHNYLIKVTGCLLA